MTLAADTRTAASSSPVGDVRQLVGVALFSATPAELAAFYGMLFGVRFERRDHGDGRVHWVSRLGSIHLEIKLAPAPDAPVAAAAPTVDGSVATELSYEFDDARAAWDYAITLGATPLLDVVEKPYGWFGSVLDPDGNRIGIYSAHDGGAHVTNTEEEGR